MRPECQEYGDFSGLDDLFTEQPDVMTGLAQIYGDWIRRYRIDGFRVDTARHVNPEFFRLWVPRVLAAAREAGVGDFEIFGEAFVRDAVALSTYVRERGLPNVLDFPLQDPVVRFAAGVAGSRGIASRFADDDYYALPNGVVHTPPTFLGNHDVGRAALNILAAGTTRSDCSSACYSDTRCSTFSAAHPLSTMATRSALSEAAGTRPRVRICSRPECEWRTQIRVGSGAIGTRSSFELVNHPISRHLRTLATLRDRHPALSTGASHAWCGAHLARGQPRRSAGAARIPRALQQLASSCARGYGDTLDALVAAPGNEGETVERPRRLAHGRSPAFARGAASRVRAHSRKLAAARPRGPGCRQPERSVALERNGNGSAVERDVRRQAARIGGLERIAVDDSPPYRAFIRRSDFQQVIAITLALDGSTAASEPLDVP